MTRNLLYHYCPRGRRDIVLAVAEQAGRELTEDWLVDDAMPLGERMAINVSRMIDHASRPTDAWRIYLLALGSRDPELSATVERFVETVVSSIALNQIGTPDPPAPVRLALRGYLAFWETVLDGARATATPPEQVVQILQETLLAAAQAGLAAERAG